MGKGHKRRPCLTSKAEERLRYQLALRQITFAEYQRKMKKVKKVRKIA